MNDNSLNAMLQKYKLVFVGGLHRSGTSLLSNCIGSHSQISTFSDTGVPEDEGQFLQSVYKPAKEYGGPGEFNFNSASHLTEDSVLVSNENALRMAKSWNKYWDTEKKVYLEKSPPNLTKMRFLQALFPRAYFIIILRHPIAVTFATRKWSQSRPDRLLNHWVVSHRYFLQDMKYIHNIVTLRYEDFVQHPDEFVKKIYTFLEIKAEENQYNIKQNMNISYYNVYESLGKRTILHQIYLNYLQIKFENKIRPFGYSLNPVNYVLSPPDYMLQL